MNILDFQKRKLGGQKISMVTCYDYSFAKILAQTNVDTILVGDSLAMTMHGHPHTLQATVELMALHTQAVVRGAPNKFIVADMPFLANRKGLTAVMNNVEKIMQTGAHALKIENANGNLKLIHHLVNSGVPVMGHLGLTPQSVQVLGGYKVQGREQKAQEKIMQDALALQEAGCFALVLECVPNGLAKQVTEKLQIPTIGIGAGQETDGQVLVLQDLLGMNTDFKAKFVRRYLNGEELISSAINKFHGDIQSGRFPSEEEGYQS